MTTELWYVYVLFDPRGGGVRYVGVAKDPKKRLRKHIEESRRSPKGNHRRCWISSLLCAGIKPTMVIIETVTGDCTAAERGWIAEFRKLGYKLVNCTDGGDGVSGYKATAEVRAKISASHLGVPKGPPTLETRSKLSAANLGRKLSPEVCRRQSLARLGHITSPETRAKISAARLGHKPSAETRQRMSIAGRGRKASPETRAKLAVARRGHEVSLETRAKISKARLGRKCSPETLAKMSASQLGHTMPPQTKSALLAFHLGRKCSPEQRVRLVAAQHLRRERERNAKP